MMGLREWTLDLQNYRRLPVLLKSLRRIWQLWSKSLHKHQRRLKMYVLHTVLSLCVIKFIFLLTVLLASWITLSITIKSQKSYKKVQFKAALKKYFIKHSFHSVDKFMMFVNKSLCSLRFSCLHIM